MLSSHKTQGYWLYFANSEDKRKSIYWIAITTNQRKYVQDILRLLTKKTCIGNYVSRNSDLKLTTIYKSIPTIELWKNNYSSQIN